MPVLGRLPDGGGDVDDAGLVEARRCGSAARMARTWLSTLTSNDARHSSSRHLVERHLPCHADVVDEHVEAAEARRPPRPPPPRRPRGGATRRRQAQRRPARRRRAARRPRAVGAPGVAARPRPPRRPARARRRADREADAGGAAGDERAPTVGVRDPRRQRIPCQEMITLLCVRHGETDANRAGRWQGHDDVPLNATGRAQAAAAAPALARLRHRRRRWRPTSRAPARPAAPLAALLGRP